MFLMIIIGLPLYVCSSASVPLAYAFIESGYLSKKIKFDDIDELVEKFTEHCNVEVVKL